MKKRVNSGTLAPLLEVARTDPDAAARHAALDAASRLTLSEEAWRSVGAALDTAASSLAHQSPERAALLVLAARVPLMSTRRALRAIAADAGDPARAAVSDALVRAGDPSQIGRLLADAASGRWQAYEGLATMPLEVAGTRLSELPAPPPEPTSAARLWHALAAARLGECRWLDPFLAGQEPEPPTFHGSPAQPYAQVAAMRPIPEALQTHLLAMQPRADAIDDAARQRMAQIVIRAATGSADAEGSPPARPTDEEPSLPSRQEVDEAFAAARDRLGTIAAGRFVLPDTLSDDDLGSLLPRLLADAQACADALPADVPAPQVIGNAVISLVGALPRPVNGRLDELVQAQLRAQRPALDDAQLAWVIARTPPSRWIGALASLLVPPERPAAERLRVLQIAMYCADHAAGRGGSPYRGAGPLAAGTPSGRGELIEDDAPAAGAEAPPEARAGPATLSIPLPSARHPPTPPDAPPPAPQAAAPASAPAAVPGAVPGDAAVFCPPVVARATAFLVQVFLHEPQRAAEARERALEADTAAQRRGVLALPPDLPLGTRIDLNLEMPLQVHEPDAALVWTGRTCAAQFEVTVPATAPLGNTIGRVRLAVAGVPIGTLRFQVAVAANAVDAQPPRDAGAEVKRYHRAFVSYSSKDRAEVLRRVQAFRIAGISVFQDVLDLEPGQRWEKQLYREIDRCDVVLLFWSTAASASPWVAKEIDYALTLKGGEADRPPDIAPVPIEGPPIPPPPERLKHLHFYDALLAHIAVARPPPEA